MQSAYFTANREAKSARIPLSKSAADGEKNMSMADRDGFIWHDGKLVPWREATTHVLTHTLHYGTVSYTHLATAVTSGTPLRTNSPNITASLLPSPPGRNESAPTSMAKA